MPARLFTDAQETVIAQRYAAGESTMQLANAFGTSDVTVGRILNRCGVVKRSPAEAHQTLSTNHDAFSVITPDSAYWAGFLMADGCVHRNKISIGLQVRDLAQVEKLKDFLCPDANISTMAPHKGMINGRRFSSKGKASITLTSDQMVADLAKFGVEPRKSLTAKVAQLEYNRHFWRGIIDGDGGVYYFRRTCMVGLVGSRAMLYQFLEFVRDICSFLVTTRVTKKGTIYRIQFSGDAARAIVRKLYTNAPTYLDRKMETAREIMRHVDGHVVWETMFQGAMTPVTAVYNIGRRTGKIPADVDYPCFFARIKRGASIKEAASPLKRRGCRRSA